MLLLWFELNCCYFVACFARRKKNVVCSSEEVRVSSKNRHRRGRSQRKAIAGNRLCVDLCALAPWKRNRQRRRLEGSPPTLKRIIIRSIRSAFPVENVSSSSVQGSTGSSSPRSSGRRCFLPILYHLVGTVAIGGLRVKLPLQT